METDSVSCNDIFSDSEAQYELAKVFEFIIQIRKVLRTHQKHAYPSQSTRQGVESSTRQGRMLLAYTPQYNSTTIQNPPNLAMSS